MRAEILPRRDNEDEQREDREQVVQPGIVTMVTIFQRIVCFLPVGAPKSMRMGEP